MNVLVTTSTFPRWNNDSGALFVYELCRRLQEKGLNIVILCPHARESKKFEIMDGMKIHRYQYLPVRFERLAYDGGISSKLSANKLNYFQIPFFLFFQLWTIRKIVKTENIDIVHAHWIIPQGLVAALYKKIFNARIKIVCTAHGSDLFAFKGIFLSWLKRMILRRADYVTVASDALKKEIHKLTVDVPVEVLPMGVDTAQFTPDRYSRQIKIKYDIQGPLLIFVGRLSAEKGIEYLIKAMPQILCQFPDAKLLVVGGGPLADELEKVCRATGSEKNTIFTGAVPHRFLPEYYATADILIGPSLREGFGLVFAEAMACGCPVVASEVGGVTDVVKDGKTGFLVKPKDSDAIAGKVIQVLRDKSLAQQIKREARAYVVAHFSDRDIAERYKKILSKIG